MSQSTIKSAVPAAILRKLRLVRQRKMFVHAASAVVAALAVLLAAMGVAMLIDYLATLYDSRWRIVLTTTALVLAASTIVGWLLVAWRRAGGLERVAAEVDRQVPRLEERWTTMTRLGDDAAKPEIIHPAMLRRVSMEAASWEPRIEPENVVSLSLLIRTMIGLTAVTAVLAVAAFLNSREVTILARRFWLPSSSISATKLVDAPGNMVIARGEPLALNVAIEGTPVQNAILFVRPDAKPAQSITLVAERREPIGFSHRMRAVEEPFAYRFRAGDGQTEWYNVDVADRPEIESIKFTLTPPAYTRQPAKTFDKLPERVSALRNSRIELAVRAKAPVDSVRLKIGNDKFLELSLESDGWYRWKTTLAESVSISPTLTEQHGLTNRRSPKCQLIAYEDQPPVVKVLAPNDRVAVRPDDAMQITFSATDDVGISSAELVVYQENGEKQPTEIKSIPIDLGEQQGARSVQQTVDLDLKKIGAKDGTELSYEIRVREDRGDNPMRIASRPTAKNADGNKPQAMATPPGSRAQAGQPSPSSATDPSQVAAAPSSQKSQSSPTSPNAPNSQANQSAQSTAQSTAQNRPSQTNSGSSQQSPAKPSATSQAANEKPMANGSKPQGQQPNAEKPAANTIAQNAAPSSSPIEQKSLASGNAPQTSGNQQPTSASNTPQSAADQKPLAAENNPQAPSDQKAMTAESKPQPTANQSSGVAKNSTPPAADLTQMVAKNTPQSPVMPQSKNPAEAPTPRTATTGRQTINTNTSPASGDQSAQTAQANQPQNANSGSANKTAANNAAANNSPAKMKDQPANQKSQASNAPAMKKNDSNPEKAMASAISSQSPTNSPQPNSPSPSQQSQSSPQPGDNMPQRSLDVPEPQSAASQRMKIKVDQWAGSFEGQQRAKLEMAIEPELEALDLKLAKAERTSRGVLDALEANSHWMAAFDREVTSAEQLIVDGKGIVDKLVAQSKDTPYAFIGLQLDDVSVAHLEPARSSFWTSLQSKGEGRVTSVRDGWQHVVRARELLKDLRGQFERSKREFKLAEAVNKVKNMYRVYTEDSQALLDVQENDPTRYGRKIAEFNLDEEYLKRLKEVLKMRADLQAELARILSEDPRLLRRFMDNIRARSNNLREQLADLSAKQDTLNREVRAWGAVDAADRQRMAQILLLRNMEEASKISTAAGELQDRFQSWLPLQKESKDVSLVAVSKQIQDVATAAGGLNARAMNFIASAQQQAAAPAPAPAASAPEAAAAKPQAADTGQGLDQLINESAGVYRNLTQLEVSLRQLASREDQPDISQFAANRLIDTRRLIADTSAWGQQMRAHKAGSYTSAAEVEQYRLAMRTDALAGKLGDLEQTLAGMLQRNDGKLPEAIAAKSRDFMAALDKEVSPNQLAAVYALHGNQVPRATERQQAAGTALTKSEKLYDELMRLAIAEMDKLPVQDPIASLLEDPTLDELLAQLEKEIPLAELLGIPGRPSNLQIINDWFRPGNNGGASGWRRLVMNQKKQNDQRTQDKLKQAYQRAIARALKENKPKPQVAMAKSAKLSDWNKLVSHLKDDLVQGRGKAPPEAYRRAIEQYFAQISREVAEQEKQSK